MGKTEDDILKAGVVLAALWFGAEIIKNLTEKCPTCGQSVTGKPLQCPHCGSILRWMP